MIFCGELGDKGFEVPPENAGNTGFLETEGALKGALETDSVEFPPDLGEVIAAWRNLDEESRNEIVRIARRNTAG